MSRAEQEAMQSIMGQTLSQFGYGWREHRAA
jgi:hypothetical protein